MTMRWKWLRITILFLLMVPLAACGSADEEVATDRTGVPDVSPRAADELPQDVETAELVIEDGDFTVDELIVHRGDPTELDVVNRDDQAYQFAIKDLVTAQDIPAGETSTIGFTTPNAGTYSGQLLDPDSGDVLAEVSVIVDAAGGSS